MKKIYVGEYSEAELKAGKNKGDVEKAQQENPELKYVVTKITKKPSIKIWISDDFDL